MTIIVLYNFRYKKLSKLYPQLLTYKQPVPYLTLNASMDNTILKSGVFPMLAFTKSTSFQTVILIGMCIGIEMSIISPLFTSKCQHGQYLTLKVEYLSPMPVFTKIIVLYNFRYKKLSKPCTQLLRYKQPVPYLTVNASMDYTVL